MKYALNPRRCQGHHFLKGFIPLHLSRQPHVRVNGRILVVQVAPRTVAGTGCDRSVSRAIRREISPSRDGPANASVRNEPSMVPPRVVPVLKNGHGANFLLKGYFRTAGSRQPD